MFLLISCSDDTLSSAQRSCRKDTILFGTISMANATDCKWQWCCPQQGKPAQAPEKQHGVAGLCTDDAEATRLAVCLGMMLGLLVLGLAKWLLKAMGKIRAGRVSGLGVVLAVGELVALFSGGLNYHCKIPSAMSRLVLTLVVSCCVSAWLLVIGDAVMDFWVEPGRERVRRLETERLVAQAHVDGFRLGASQQEEEPPLRPHREQAGSSGYDGPVESGTLHRLKRLEEGRGSPS